GELVGTRRQPAHELAFALLFQNSNLVGEPSQVGTGAITTTATEHGTGDGTDFTVCGNFPVQKFRQAGTQTGTDQARLHGLGAADSHNALDRHFTGFEQLGDIDHILVVDRPDSLAGRYRVQVMDVGTNIACRVHAIKLVDCD